MEQRGTTPAGTASPSTNLALGLAGAAVLVFVIAMVVATDGNDWLWPLAGLLGASGAVAGWRADRPRPQGKALLAVVMGGLVFLIILGWIIWAASTGNF